MTDLSTKYRALSDVEHIRLRPQMYVGPTDIDTKTMYILENSKMQQRDLQIVPALIKIIDEVIDNSIDEHKRNPDKLNQLKVDFSDNYISIWDNGGIPVQIHPEYNIYVPELIFGQLRSGSNYNDEQEQMLVGTHGLGAKATNILSKSFVVETADGKNYFSQTFSDGMSTRSTPSITKSTKKFTKITFQPDFEFFKLQGLTEHHKLKIQRKLFDVAGNNPNLQVFCNGQEIKIKNFQDYIALYTDNFVYEDYGDWKIGVSSSSGFAHTSFVNSVDTYVGGTHIDYVANQIITALREHVKKKFKIDVKPADVKSQLHLFISCNINRPKFSSQTKENMVSLPTNYGTSVTISEKFIKKIIASDVVQKILDWAAAKKAAADAEELRKAGKSIAKTNPKTVEKFDDAVERNDRLSCTLFLAEGLSAKNSVISARGKNKFYGCYALKGKIMNVDGVKPTEVLANSEISDILTITGLQLGQPVSRDADSSSWFTVNGVLVNLHDIIWVGEQCIKVWEYADKTIASPSIVEIMEYRKNAKNNKIFRRPADLRFGKIAILSDADLDGSHIAALAILFFQTFWPELFEMGCIYRMETPVYIATERRSKKEHYFFNSEDYEGWAEKAPAHNAEYFKGLGTFKTEQFEKFFTMIDDLLVQFPPPDQEDIARLTLAFNSDKQFADMRKNWLEDVSYFNKED
jgi:DNA topoisomerase-2